MTAFLQKGRGAALAIVIAALATLLLWPYCGAAEHPDSGTPLSESCCAQVSDGTVVTPAALVSWPSDAPPGAALFLLAGLPLFPGSRPAARFRPAAPPERSFYARSARILR